MIKSQMVNRCIEREDVETLTYNKFIQFRANAKLAISTESGVTKTGVRDNAAGGVKPS